MNKGWKVGRLKVFPINFIDGDRSSRYPKRSEFVEEGILFLNAESISGEFLNTSAANFISEEKFATIRKGRLQQSDVVLTMRGNGVGKVGFFHGGSAMGLINAQMLIIRPIRDVIDPRFLYYLLRSPYYFDCLCSLATGSAQPQLSITSLKEMEVSIPPLVQQKRMSVILSAYDDLIENNLRRIKILEEMAQSLYCEWFIKFRFPGYQHTRFTDSPLDRIPEGWEVVSLGKLTELRKDKFNEKMHSECPLLDLAKMQQRTLSVGETGSPDELTTSRIIFEEDDILFGSIRPYLHKVALAPCRGVTNVSVLVIRPVEKSLQSFLAILLSSINTIRWADQHSTGTKMPVIKWEALQTIPVLMPVQPVLRAFETSVQPILQTVKMISLRNQNLRRTRDLLLPRLISGEVDVSALDIDVPEEAGA